MCTRRYVEVVLYKTYADLKAESSRTYLSFLWWILDPLLTMVVFYLVFKVFLKQGTDNFVGFLLIGLVFWKWFSSSVQHALNSINIHRGLIQQIYLPKYLFPIITVCTDFAKFALVLCMLLGFVLATSLGPTGAWASLPVLILCQLLLIAGCSCLLAAIAPFLPDIRLLTDSALTLLMFLSGVFFEASAIPEAYRQYFYYNPMAVLLNGFRGVLLNGQLPDWSLVFYVFLLAVVVLLSAIALLLRFDRVYPRLTLA